MRVTVADQYCSLIATALDVPEVDRMGRGSIEQNVDRAFQLFNIADQQRHRTSRLHQSEAQRQCVTDRDRVIDNTSGGANSGVRQALQPQDLWRIGARGKRLIILKMDRMRAMDRRTQPSEAPPNISL